MNCISFSRRGLLAGVLSTSALHLLPRYAKAEPATVLAAGAAVVGIVSGVASFFSDARKERVLSQINGKLDAVIRSQSLILAEIADLRLFIEEALSRSFRENAIVRMNAHQDRFEVLSSDKVTSANRGEYIDLQADVSQSAFELGQYDTPAYIAYGAGVAMTLAIHLAVGGTRERHQALKKVFVRAYDRWLDPNNAQSIVAIIASTRSEIERRVAALNGRPRTFTASERRGLCTYTTVTTVNGDFTSGFSVTQSQSHECELPDICDRRPTLCPRALGEEFLGTEEEVSQNLAGLMTSLQATATPLAVPSVETVVPEFIPSGHGVVDEMNRERIAIFQLMNVLSRQEVIKGQMEECRTALAA